MSPYPQTVQMQIKMELVSAVQTIMFLTQMVNAFQMSQFLSITVLFINMSIPKVCGTTSGTKAVKKYAISVNLATDWRIMATAFLS